MKKFIALALVLISFSSIAAERSLTKTTTPSRIVVAKAGVGLAYFSVMSRDFPGAQLFQARKQLTSVEWTTTHFPDNLDEQVELCYFKPTHVVHEPCVAISPNSTGTEYAFNPLMFDKHARFVIKHHVKGGRNHGAPAGVDKIVINYSY